MKPDGSARPARALAADLAATRRQFEAGARQFLAEVAATDPASATHSAIAALEAKLERLGAQLVGTPDHEQLLRPLVEQWESLQLAAFDRATREKAAADAVGPSRVPAAGGAAGGRSTELGSSGSSDEYDEQESVRRGANALHVCLPLGCIRHRNSSVRDSMFGSVLVCSPTTNTIRPNHLRRRAAARTTPCLGSL